EEVVRHAAERVIESLRVLHCFQTRDEQGPVLVSELTGALIQGNDNVRSSVTLTVSGSHDCLEEDVRVALAVQTTEVILPRTESAKRSIEDLLSAPRPLLVLDAVTNLAVDHATPVGR